MAATERMNRAFGWAGLAWIAALASDIYVLADRVAHDLKFCSVAQGSVPQGFYDGNASNAEGSDALRQATIHPLSKAGLDKAVQDTDAIPDTFTCNVSAKMMQRLKKRVEVSGTAGHVTDQLSHRLQRAAGRQLRVRYLGRDAGQRRD